MMPAYSKSRVSIIFFGSFLLFGTFFLLNLVLAVVVNEHPIEPTNQSTSHSEHLP